MTKIIIINSALLLGVLKIKTDMILEDNGKIQKLLRSDIPTENKLVEIRRAKDNVVKLITLSEVEDDLILQMTDLKYAADKAAIERWVKNKKKELLGE